MLKIVEVHTGAGAQSEYLVLQNHGLVSVSLRGWALCTDAYLSGDERERAAQMYVFCDDMAIKPYTRVVLFTGCGENGWVPTTDGKQAYCAYWNRAERIWHGTTNVHLLNLSTSRRVHTPPTIRTTSDGQQVSLSA